MTTVTSCAPGRGAVVLAGYFDRTCCSRTVRTVKARNVSGTRTDAGQTIDDRSRAHAIDLGPFTFDRVAYERALGETASLVSRPPRRGRVHGYHPRPARAGDARTVRPRLSRSGHDARFRHRRRSGRTPALRLLGLRGEFDEIFARIRDRALRYWADPFRHEPDQINTWDGGRGVYFDDPNGHLLEIITRPYVSGGTTTDHPHALTAPSAGRTTADPLSRS
jgi:hypothetical protein